MSGASVGVGLGVTVGVLAVLAIILVVIGLCTSRKRTRDIENEMERRRQALRESHIREQQQWRERRLRDVVLVLIDRGEACEGIPLAFKLSGHNEVAARRRLRNPRRGANNQILSGDDDDAVTRGLDEQAQAIVRMTLPELLVNGRPADAEPAPDVMQMLLEGQELRRQPSAEDTENEDEFLISETASASAAGGNGEGAGSSPAASFTPADDALQDPVVGAGAAAAQAPSSDQQSTALSQENPQQKKKREMEEALIKKLQEERKHGKRRRKTAEEVYGSGLPYIRNPNNDVYLKMREESVVLEEPRSPIMRFLTPLTPFRGRKKRKSAFDGVSSPAGSPTLGCRGASVNFGDERKGSTYGGGLPTGPRHVSISHNSTSSEPF